MISRGESFEWIWERIIEINDKLKPHWRKWNIALLGNNLGKEVGEVQEIISIWLEGGTKKKPRPTVLQMIEENVDYMVYGIMLLERLNVDYDLFMEIFRQKLDIVEERLIKLRDEK